MAYPQGGLCDSSSRLDNNSRFCLADEAVAVFFAVTVFFFFWVPRATGGATAAGMTAAFFTFFFFFIGTRGEEKGSLEVFAMGDLRGSGKEVGR
jgi:hypothetical protein